MIMYRGRYSTIVSSQIPRGNRYGQVSMWSFAAYGDGIRFIVLDIQVQ